MLVPDFMHEFELGVFKAFFIYLLRILYAHGESAIQNLNIRFRLIPTFGRSTIRCFTQNTSALKKLAAWNYQSILLVRLSCNSPHILYLLACSALSLSSKGYFQSHTTPRSWTSCSLSPNGTLWRS
ncbi:hypothetical protein B0H10DRAFT_1902393 [Mycena sp. CBHHK59/15]|nr:hypothetical protein B0H10DRAFT_1902393 [Mycena sp. CBHHK59/15]